jgi:hypothetical protein
MPPPAKVKVVKPKVIKPKAVKPRVVKVKAPPKPRVVKVKAPPKPRVIKVKAPPKPTTSFAKMLSAKAQKQSNLDMFGLANGSKAKFISNFKKLKKSGYDGLE